jgi:hypothetical protein
MLYGQRPLDQVCDVDFKVKETMAVIESRVMAYVIGP